MTEKLYRGVLLRMSEKKFLEHKAAKGEWSWEEYFDVDTVRGDVVA
jgi:hypothetical protein